MPKFYDLGFWSGMLPKRVNPFRRMAKQRAKDIARHHDASAARHRRADKPHRESNVARSARYADDLARKEAERRAIAE